MILKALLLLAIIALEASEVRAEVALPTFTQEAPQILDAREFPNAHFTSENPAVGNFFRTVGKIGAGSIDGHGSHDLSYSGAYYGFDYVTKDRWNVAVESSEISLKDQGGPSVKSSNVNSTAAAGLPGIAIGYGYGKKSRKIGIEEFEVDSQKVGTRLLLGPLAVGYFGESETLLAHQTEGTFLVTRQATRSGYGRGVGLFLPLSRSPPINHQLALEWYEINRNAIIRDDPFFGAEGIKGFELFYLFFDRFSIGYSTTEASHARSKSETHGTSLSLFPDPIHIELHYEDTSTNDQRKLATWSAGISWHFGRDKNR